MGEKRWENENGIFADVNVADSSKCWEVVPHEERSMRDFGKGKLEPGTYRVRVSFLEKNKHLRSGFALMNPLNSAYKETMDLTFVEHDLEIIDSSWLACISCF